MAVALILALFGLAVLMADSKRQPVQIVGAVLLIGLCVGTPTVLG